METELYVILFENSKKIKKSLFFYLRIRASTKKENMYIKICQYCLMKYNYILRKKILTVRCFSTVKNLTFAINNTYLGGSI